MSLREIAPESIVDVRDDFAPNPHNHVDRISRLCGVRLHVDRHAPNLNQLLQDVRATALSPYCRRRFASWRVMDSGVCRFPNDTQTSRSAWLTTAIAMTGC